MWKAYGGHLMSDGPSIDEFMRHLQAVLDDAATISDDTEREKRLWQIEATLQETIIFKNRYLELKEHGIDPLRLIDFLEVDPNPPRTSAAEAVITGSSNCGKCGAHMDADLDFCPSCGKKK